ncbi:hypothetical protein XENOCAPTIV_029171 [Xenoophorus captivus]|uniref:Uncharacterized protein n=1 Tax=Xenoophorus captivus TaxID=1517983 RepID=A0ABV0RVT5_9TELE
MVNNSDKLYRVYLGELKEQVGFYRFQIPEVYTPLLERLLVVQIDSFPQYSERMQFACSRSILKVFVAVASKGPVLWSFISSDNSSESSEVRTGKWKVPSSANYLPLYKGLLDCDQLKDSGFLDAAFESQNAALGSLSRLLYEELVKSILRIVEKLDLSVQKITTGEEPLNTQSLWICSEEFCFLLLHSELLLNKHVEYFHCWMFPLSHELILHSIRNPLVSGFYKLLLGLSHVPLANAALDALEDWSSCLPPETMQPCYADILPLLDGYLKTTSSSVVSSEEMMKKFVAWDSEKRLSFAVPFADMKPVIYLDPFLPRISELALFTSDRQTKVFPYSSLVVYMVGKSAQMVEGENKVPPMYKLHKKLFPVLLRLACDVDQDGVIDPMDSSLRDFCGRCIEEFVKWSIKQTTPKQQEKSPTNMKSLFKRIYSLALHPNGFKRLGAALAFNSIYREFRCSMNPIYVSPITDF